MKHFMFSPKSFARMFRIIRSNSNTLFFMCRCCHYNNNNSRLFHLETTTIKVLSCVRPNDFPTNNNNASRNKEVREKVTKAP